MKLPTLIEDMDFETYLADPCDPPSLTSSLVRSLLSTAPRKVWEKTHRLNKNAKDENKTIFDIGTAVHATFTGSGNPIAVIDAKDYRSGAAKDARQEAYDNGQTPVLIGKIDEVYDMGGVAKFEFGKNSDIGPILKGALKESTIIWREDGVMCRCRPDFYHKKENVIVHFKTTGTTIHESLLPKFASNQGWEMTAAHYRAGAKMLTGKAPKQYFAIQETEPPYLCMVAELDSMFMDIAIKRRQRAAYIWAQCLNAGVWPRHSSVTVKLECPPWHEAQLLEQEDKEQYAKSKGKDVMAGLKKLSGK